MRFHRTTVLGVTTLLLLPKGFVGVSALESLVPTTKRIPRKPSDDSTIAQQPSKSSHHHALCPPISPATGLPNQFYNWKEGQSIRYQVTGDPDGEPVLLIHGLFVNSDHWRKTLTQLNQQSNTKDNNNKKGKKQSYRIYAIDLFGCGYSDKPPSQSPVAQRCNGENRRFYHETSKMLQPKVLCNIPLCCPDGETIRVRDIELTHPIRSPYNFYTWSDLVVDFCRDVILPTAPKDSTVSLVSNSIGTISAFQAVTDVPQLFNGVFVVSPNYRELHSAEVAVPQMTMPILRTMQALLRKYGHIAYEALARPASVKEILKVPYAVDTAVDDTLVQVLLDPLLTPGAMEVVFDTLSYSAGPLPEQQLQMFPHNKPVWVCYGKDDPWTPSPRVEAMLKLYSPVVERVQGWKNVGHCPHDEAPELVHPMLLEFLQRVHNSNNNESS